MGRPKLNRTCSIEGCTRKHAATGLCITHYMRLQRSGSLDAPHAERPEGVALRLVPSDPRYLAGDDGHIYSTRLHSTAVRRLAERPTHDGYLRIRIPFQTPDGRTKHRSQVVHVLVAEAFHGPRPEGLQVRHLDGDSTNNSPSNLCWGTAKENASDRERHRAERSLIHNSERKTA